MSSAQSGLISASIIERLIVIFSNSIGELPIIIALRIYEAFL